MNRDELLDKLAMKLAEWPNKSGVFAETFFIPSSQYYGPDHPDAVVTTGGITSNKWLQRREELINCPPDNEAPEWSEWKCQDSDGWWCWFSGKPDISGTAWHYDEKPHKSKAGKKGETPSGHRWEDTLTRIKRDDNTSTPEEEAEFERIQARIDSEKPHEADARMLDAQLERDIATFREVYKIAEDEFAILCGADSREPDSHYRHEYKGIKLDPYRIAKIYNMNGGPREQIMKKTLRFTDKDQTEQQVVNEIRSALDRWQQMLDEDQ